MERIGLDVQMKLTLQCHRYAVAKSVQQVLKRDDEISIHL
jgi:hypothetical protein